MAGLEDMWSRFSLTEEEEGGADVPRQGGNVIHRLAGKFFTKRVVNAEAVARTFKPLWKLIGELKIRDVGGNVLLFEFGDALDLERVLEFEPWSYDKHLVAFERAVDAESAPSLSFSKTVFWVQLHNIPEQCLTQETGESVGNMLGTTIQVADAEDDGSGNEFLRVRVVLDISKPLPRCCKLRSEGEHIGWVLLKFERLPNFCYWCGRVIHNERECELWLRSKGNLKKEEQQYGDWLRAETVRSSRKTVVTVAGRATGKTPWKKGPAMPSKSCSQPPTEAHRVANPSSLPGAISEHVMVEAESMARGKEMAVSPILGNVPASNTNLCLNIDMVHSSLDCLRNNMQVFSELRSPNVTATPNHNNTFCSKNDVFAFNATKGQLSDISNKLTSDSATASTRKWKKIERVGNGDNESVDMIEVEDRRPSLDIVDVKQPKRKCMGKKNGEDKENEQVVAGYQHHRGL